jgi:hypothetical protein
MDQDLQILCEDIFCKHVDKLFAERLTWKQHRDGYDYVEAPLIGDWYPVEQIEALKRIVSRALIAQAGWELQKPQGAPRLPLTAGEIGRLKSNLRPSRQVMGCYAESLRRADWNRHPSWEDYCAGLCALRVGLMHNDGLWVHPRPLPGLDSKTLYWEPLERKMERVYAKLGIPAPTGIVRR